MSQPQAVGAGRARGRGCPERPTSLSARELGFAPKPMVRWLEPRQLVDTSARVVLSGIFGAYADKRELQALMAAEVYDHSGAEELWLDYVADLGDGWDPTYTVATTLGAAQLELAGDGGPLVTERGRVLVMGGDQVYPVPKRADYENRLLGPYRAALPCTHEDHPELFAVPGTHDWYDGLVNFVSVFCRGYWIGGWQTRQSRSYFALRLPHRWWLWGLDIQFGAYIDDAQLRYFSEVAAPQVAPGDRIILCTAKAPGTTGGHPHLYAERNVDFFEREVIRPTGAEVAIELASSRHHYAHYVEENGPRHHISSGGGGAFLHPTHHLPERLELGEDGRRGTYRRAATYPSVDASKRLRKRLWLLPFRNLRFVAVLGAVHVLVALMLSLHLRGRHEALTVGDLRHALWTSPTAVLLLLIMLVIMGAMVRFAHDAPGVTRLLLGVAHSGLQLVALAGVMIGASRLSTAFGLGGLASLVAFLGGLGVLGGLVGGLGLAGYLWATNCVGFHANEAFAPLRVKDYKHFLRLHIGADGGLTVFPVGIDRVGRRWRLEPDAAADSPWLVPEGGIEARLVEGPLRIPGPACEPAASERPS